MSGTVSKKRDGCIFAALSLFLGFALVAVASKCSFLYGFHDNTDIQCFITTARCMLRGDVLYRDVYEHKGPMLYFLYAIALKIFPRSLTGVYIAESLLFSVFLHFSGKIVSLYTQNPMVRFFSMLICGVPAVSGIEFFGGSQCEEFALPFVAISLYLVMKYFKSPREKGIPASYAIVIGLCFAVVFWMKYTATGGFIGLVLAVIIIYIHDKNVKGIFACAGQFLVGFLVGSLPVIIYFGVKGAFDSLWDVYFYTLIFKYGGVGSDDESHVILASFLEKLQATSIIFNIWSSVLFLEMIFLKKSLDGRTRLAIGSMVFFSAFFTGISMIQAYSPEVMFAYTAAALVGFIAYFSKEGSGIWKKLQLLGSDMRSFVHGSAFWTVILFATLMVSIRYLESYMFLIFQIAIVFVVCRASLWLNDWLDRHRSPKAKVVMEIAKIMFFYGMSAASSLGYIFLLVLFCIIFIDFFYYLEPIILWFQANIPQWKEEYRQKRGVLEKALVIFGLIFAVYLAYFNSPVSYDLGRSLESYPQYEMSQYILNSGVEEPIILNYDCLDIGLYWLTDTYPPEGKFCSYNLYTMEELGYIDNYIATGKADFICSFFDESGLEDYGYVKVYGKTDSYVAEQYIDYVLYARADIAK